MLHIFFLKNIGRQLATLESGVGDCKSWPSFIPSAVDCQPRQGANPTPLLFFQWGGFFLAKFHYNLRPQNPPQNPLSPVEEGIFHPQKMDLKWPLKQEKFRSKDWIISLYTNSLGWGSCVVVQTLVPTPQKNSPWGTFGLAPLRALQRRGVGCKLCRAVGVTLRRSSLALHPTNNEPWFFFVCLCLCLGKKVVTWERGFERLGSLRWFQEMTFVSENDVYR